MMLFRIVGKELTAVEPGSVLVDNQTIFDLPGAATKTGKSEAYLRELHIAFWGELIPNVSIGGEELSKPSKRSKAVKAAAAKLSPDELDDYAREALYGELSDAGWETFKARCRELGLSYLCRQLHPMERIDGNTGELRLHIIVGIDAMGTLAKRTGDYEGFGKFLYCGDDMAWVDAWNPDGPPPTLCRAQVFVKSFREPVVMDAAWKSYAPYVNTPNGQEIDPSWLRWHFQQLNKCALALAMRRGLPEALAGLFVPEEMKQMDSFQPDPTKTPRPPQRSADSQISGDNDSQVDETIDEDDFKALLAEAIPNPTQRQLAMSAYQIRYKALWRAQSHRFYVMVARDLREMIRQREAG